MTYDKRIEHRAAVDAGYASLQGYIEQWGHEVVSETQKRYADDITVQELVRLRVENERLREALRHYACNCQNTFDCLEEQCGGIALSALQQKKSE